MKRNNMVIAVCLPLLICLGVSSCALFIPPPYYELDTSHLSDNFIDQILKESAYKKERKIWIDEDKITTELLAYLNEHYGQVDMFREVQAHLQSIGAQCEMYEASSSHCVYLQYWDTPFVGFSQINKSRDAHIYACIEIESHVTNQVGIQHSIVINTFYDKMQPICQQKIAAIDAKKSIYKELVKFESYYKLDTSHLSDNFIDQILKDSAYKQDGKIRIAEEDIKTRLLAYLDGHYGEVGVLRGGGETYLKSIGAQCKVHEAEALYCVYLQYWNTPFVYGFTMEKKRDAHIYACIEIESHATARGDIYDSVIVNTLYTYMHPVCQKEIDAIIDVPSYIESLFGF